MNSQDVTPEVKAPFSKTIIKEHCQKCLKINNTFYTITSNSMRQKKNGQKEKFLEYLDEFVVEFSAQSEHFTSFVIKALTLSDLRIRKLTSYFADFQRAWFCSDRHRISAKYRTACPVHCQKKKSEIFSKLFQLQLF